MKIKEKHFISIFIIIALLGLPFISYDFYNESQKTSFISKEYAIDKARDFLISNQILEESKNYKSSLNITLDEQGYSFLIAEFGEDEANKIVEKLNLSPMMYSIKFGKFLSPKAEVLIDMQTGEIAGFNDLEEEKEQEKFLIPEEAINLTLKYLEQKGYDKLTEINFDAKFYIEKGENESQVEWETLKNKTNRSLQDLENISYIPKGTTYFLTFKINGSEFETSYGKSEIHIETIIKGDKITKIKGPFIHVPEKFINELEEQSKKGKILTLLAVIATFIMLILGLIVMIKGMITKKIRWRFFLLLSIIILLLGILDIINGYLIVKNPVYSIIILISAIFGGAILFIFGSAGDILSRKVWKEKGALLQDLIKSKPLSKKYGISIIKGYLFALALLTITLVNYFIGEKYLSVKSFPDTEILNTFVSFSPVYSLFILALIAAVGEEFIYRFFGISFFKDKIKSTFVAVLIPTIIWAIAHSDYPVFPFYFRAIELTIIGLFFGYIFLRYNLTTVVTIHFVYNALVGLPLMFMINNVSGLAGGIFVVSLPLIIALILLTKPQKKKK